MNNSKVIYSSEYDTRKKYMNASRVIYSRTNYGTDKITTMRDTTNGIFKYPVLHSINKKGLVFWYSSTNEMGHFGIPKVILNFNGIQYNYPEQNDYEGKYGMSQISFGIPISSKEEGDLILKAIGTEKFKTMIKSSKWGIFQTDYRMFQYFKKDWYKAFIE